TSLISIGEAAFEGCSCLLIVSLPTSRISINPSAFRACVRLTEFTVNDGNLCYCVEDGVLFDKTKETLLRCPPGKTGVYKVPEGVTVIETGAFEDCIGLTGVVMPASVKQIKEGAFFDCDNLTRITIPAGVQWIEKETFYGCDRLSSVAIPASVTKIGGRAFENCDVLSDVEYGGSRAQWKSIEIEEYAKREIEESYDGEYEDFHEELKSSLIHCTDGTIDGMRGTCGNELTWTLDRNGVLTVKGMGTMGDWPEIFGEIFPWNRKGALIQAAIFEPGVTGIGKDAFWGCRNMKSVAIPDSVTSIGGGAFENCSALETVILSDNITEMEGGIFSGCTGLTSVSLPSGLTSIEHAMFQDCGNLPEIRLPDSVTYIDDFVFCGCWRLASISIPSGVTAIGEYAFFDCRTLSEIVIPEKVHCISEDCFMNSGLKKAVLLSDSIEIGEYAFENCDGIRFYCRPGTDTERALEKQGFVRGREIFDLRCADGHSMKDGICSVCGLGEYVLSETNVLIGCPNASGDVEILDGLGIRAIGEKAFAYNAALTQVAVPDGVRIIGSEAFRDCRNLRVIKLPATIEHIGEGAFEGANPTIICAAGSPAREYVQSAGLRAVDPRCTDGHAIKDGVCAVCGEPVFAVTDGVLTGYAGAETDVVIPGGLGVKTIARSAFSGSGITSVAVPEGVAAIDEYAFAGCGSLKRVQLPDSLRSIGRSAFEDCANLETAVLPDGLRRIESRTFMNCERLESVRFPASGEFTYIGRRAFSGCCGITEIVLPDSVLDVNTFAFADCTGLRKATLSQGMLEIRSALFEGCVNLEEIRLPDGLREIAEDGFDAYWAFSGCPVEDMAVYCRAGTPASVLVTKYSLGGGAFAEPD
ncbi:MAG: leucine-rich repeat domain-containing protein, partial [Clostridia bacterium]|nr:leucine-rich repeat domain-containing protein [Clostridia bacterium]